MVARNVVLEARWTNTATNTTRPTPIISAAASTAVRPGFRIVFSRASRPVGRRSAPAASRSRWPAAAPGSATTIATAMNTSMAPSPSASSTWVPLALPSTAVQRSAADRRCRAMTADHRRVPCEPRRRQLGTLAKRGDGRDPGRAERGSERSQERHRRPRRSAGSRSVRRRCDGRPCGSPIADRGEQAVEQLARRRCRARSRSTRGVAASRTPRAARSASPGGGWRRACAAVASSRMRWATVIENVLKMMNAPTNTATPPNASRSGRQEAVDRARETLLLDVWRVLGARLDPHVAAAPPAGCGASAPRRLTPLSAATRISDVCPSRSNQYWASLKVVLTRVAPPIEPTPASVNAPTSGHGDDALLGREPDLLADLQVLVLEELLADRRCRRTGWPVALDVVRRGVERRREGRERPGSGRRCCC